MTATESLSLNESLDSDVTESAPDTNWDALAPAEKTPDLAPASSRPDAEPGTCLKCGDPIIREPGARGRMPKYHPDCRPKSGASSGVVSRRSSKVDAEATEALAAFESMVVKFSIMLSMVDRYDAFCLMIGWSQVKPNLLEVLKRYAGFRKEMLALKTGGSLIGLGIAVLMTTLPILAHHGMIPWKSATEVLVKAPFTLYNIQQKLAEGAAGLQELMAEQLQAMREAQNAKVTAATKEDTERVNGHGRA